MTSKAVSAIALLCLVGCAQKVWYKPGATQQDFAVDSYACEKDARQSGYFGSGLVGQINFQDFGERCMVAHGWSISNSSARPAAAPPTSDWLRAASSVSRTSSSSPSEVADCVMPDGSSLITTKAACDQMKRRRVLLQ
jgi:hypothetical protein